jgi:hypothetical protein
MERSLSNGSLEPKKNFGRNTARIFSLKSRLCLRPRCVLSNLIRKKFELSPHRLLCDHSHASSSAPHPISSGAVNRIASHDEAAAVAHLRMAMFLFDVLLLVPILSSRWLILPLCAVYECLSVS